MSVDEQTVQSTALDGTLLETKRDEPHDVPGSISRLAWLKPALGDRSPLESSIAPPNSLRRDAIFRRALIVSDVLAGAVAVGVALSLDPAAGPTVSTLALLPLVVLFGKLLGLYDRDDLVFHKSTLDEAPLLFQLATLFTLVTWLVKDPVLKGAPGETGILTLWIGSCVLFVTGRSVARRLAEAAAPAERCLIVGPSGARMRFTSKLIRAHRGTEVAAHLPIEDERRRPVVPGSEERRRRDLSLTSLEDIVREFDVHRAIIIPGDADPDTMLEAVARAKAAGVKVSLLPRMCEVVGSSVEFDDVEGMTVLGLRRFGLARSSSFIKRSLDLTLATFGLLLLAPFVAVIAAAIKADSRGPVIYRQQRVGRGGRIFEMFKFRSMCDGADAQRAALAAANESRGLFKLSDDPRVTRVGRLLRRSSLDELPQLINVLRGEMSLVGPRPLVPHEDQLVEGRHRGRLNLAPGLTGPWQLLGPVRVPLEDMVTLDYLYGANWSLWADIKILLRTVSHVFGRRGM